MYIVAGHPTPYAHLQVQELPKEKRTLALQLALGELQMPEAFGMPSDPRLLFGGLMRRR